MESLYSSPSPFSPIRSPSDELPASPELPSFSSDSGNNSSNETLNRSLEILNNIEPPNWLTEELEQEWTGEEADNGVGYRDEEQEESRNDETSTYSNYATPRANLGSSLGIPSTVHPLGTLNRPRVPSSLRFATSLSNPASPIDEASPSSAAGTWVMKDGSVRSGSGEENQLQAAVRALKGPSSGLGAPEDVDDGSIVFPAKTKKTKDRLGGLMRLFEAPKNLLPPSSAPAPSLEAFNFTPPPQGPRTSWKSLNHFSPPGLENENTPHGMMGKSSSDTPSRSASLNHSSSKSRQSSPLSNSQILLPFPTTPAPTAYDDQLSPQQPELSHSLFQFQYDTFTRNHLASLVEEIDELSSENSRNEEDSEEERKKGVMDQAWETSFIEISPLQNQDGEDEDEDDGSRSSKRIRLSPEGFSATPAVQSRRNSRISFSTGARRRSGRSFSRESYYSDTSPTNSLSRSARSEDRFNRSNVSTQSFDGRPATVGKPAKGKDRFGEPNAVMERIRAREKERRDLETEKIQDDLMLDLGGEEKTPTLESTAKLQAKSKPSPRKLLRRLSSSLEVDSEVVSSGLSESENEGKNYRNGGEKVHRMSTTEASIRLSLSPKKSRSSGTGNGWSELAQPVSPLRKQFVKTPTLNSISTSSRQSKPQPINYQSTSSISTSSSSQDNWNSRKISTATATSSTGTGSTNTLLGTPGGHQRKMTTIGPNDFEELLAATATPSGMIFDSQQNKWIKAKNSNGSLGSSVGMAGFGSSGGGEEGNSTEEDPFKDFDSIRISEEDNNSSNISGSGLAALSRLSGLGITSSGRKVSPENIEEEESREVEESIEEEHWEGEVVIEHEVEGTYLERVEEEVTADFDNSQDPFNEFETEEEDGTDQLEFQQELTIEEEESDEEFGEEREESPFLLYKAIKEHERSREQELEEAEIDEEMTAQGNRSILPIDISTPLVLRPSYGHVGTPSFSSSTPPMSPSQELSILPSTPLPATNSPPLPRSVLKPANIRSQSEAILSTPRQISPKEPRSVSFSDGKRNGKIQNAVVKEFATTSGLKFEFSNDGNDGSGFSPVSREGGDTLELELERDFADDSIVGAPQGQGSATPERISPRVFQRTTSCDATFLTNCSFSVSGNRIIELLTDIEPFVKNWEVLNFINLSGKGVESLIKLKEFLPILVGADLSNNLISHLTGLPETVRSLQLSANRLNSIASFAHLRNLERLDVSNNQIDSLYQFSSLVHLREFKADYNLISDLGGLGEIEGLQNLSLKGNKIDFINFSKTKWSRLETLNLSRNQIVGLSNLESLSELSYLDLDHNLLETVQVATTMPRLRILRICSNPLIDLDIGFATKLRTLYVDGGKLNELTGTDRLRKLENLSVRNQNGAAIAMSMMEIRDVKRLYLSENSIPSSFPSVSFYNLIYLELAMCQLETLPANLSSLIPNVRFINLNYNFIHELTPLIGLERLKKIEVVGNRLKSFRGIVEVVKTWKEIESIDFRMNPATLQFYPPIIEISPPLPSHQSYTILHPADSPSTPPTTLPMNYTANSATDEWSKKDFKFASLLPKNWLLKRNIYRKLIAETLPKLLELDGVELGRRERRRLRNLEG